PNPSGAVVLDLRKTQAEVAAALGCSRAAASHYLAQFQQRGWIAVEGVSVLAKNVEGLRRRAGAAAD
ncbi:MAG: helix-turn-helix domain-containing protein, partial [Actinomycetota bacterium]